MENEFNPLELAMKSKTFCVLPFIHQYVGPGGDVTPCCVFNSNWKFNDKALPLGNLKEQSLKEVWNNDRTKELRLEVLTGKEPNGCYVCTSRQSLNDDYKSGFNYAFMSKEEIKQVIASTKIDGEVENHKLFYIDARWNNLCNFKCRMCSPEYSTGWIEDYKKISPRSKKTFLFSGKTEDDLLDQIIPHLDTVQQLYFAGGEPLMQKEHYEVLKKVIEIGNFDVDIVYNTNLSQLKLKGYEPVYHYWNKLKKVEVAASIDGSYERAEYWRSGTNWNKIVENVKTIKKESPHIKFKISFTISWINAFNLITLHKEWVENGLIGINDINVNPLDFPDYYSLKNIPEWKKDEIENAFNQYKLWLKEFPNSTYFLSRIDNAIGFMRSDKRDIIFVKEKMREFNHYTRQLDMIRSEDFYKTFPEHENIRQFINGIKETN
jgi:MoaA/NifB/PqqE/SkfB family radical SAM enzyme